jgi:hypothetical protein
MISFNLRCAKDHVFEAWFKDGAAFDKQAKSKSLSCPSCGNTKIEKAIMAPAIARGASRADTPSPEQLRSMLLQMRAAVESNCDYVGQEFPEEARKIHYGEADARNIYGEATPEEAKELAEEGVEFGSIPWIQHTDS